MGKTNAKRLLAGFGISQSNPYLVAKLFHFTSLSLPLLSHHSYPLLPFSSK